MRRRPRATHPKRWSGHDLVIDERLGQFDHMPIDLESMHRLNPSNRRVAIGVRRILKFTNDLLRNKQLMPVRLLPPPLESDFLTGI